MPKKIKLSDIQLFDSGYTAVSNKISFTEFTFSQSDAIVHLPTASTLIIIVLDAYGTQKYPLVKVYNNKTDATIDLGISAKTYFYFDADDDFTNVLGIFIYDEQGNTILSPWSAMRATLTEFAALLDPNMFILKGITF